ncbi:MAG TPA: nucleoside-diphosphate sugar epimerase/dehydratase, partial [Candidatus Limnocylindrales bacterium]|nr:nucleoside-diphosphate sugar epimerase/dehydratase [Candidatus Limnocylindrales bacterium]
MGPIRPSDPAVRWLRFAEGRSGFLLVFADLVGMSLASYAALALRFESFVMPMRTPAFPLALLILVGARLVVNLGFGLYSCSWRYASVPDLVRVVVAVSLGSALAAGLFYATTLTPGSVAATAFPRAFWPLEALLSMAVLGGARFSIRAGDQVALRLGPASRALARPTILYGAGAAGVALARSAARNPGAGIRPVAFLDDDPARRGRIVAGLRVIGGLADMRRAVATTGARSLLVTMPSAPGPAVRRAVEAALALGLEVRTVPPLTDLLDGSVDAFRVRQVRVDDLLRRPAITDHAAGVDDLVRGRTVLVTGGAGSIGSELARQVFAIGPRRLVLVDRAESPLYLIERELGSRRRRGQGSGEVCVHLANVASRAEMERFVRRERPNLIFHAAAYKHVPLLEDHPSDAVHVNVGGTMALLDAAIAADVERFVFVSTDKAVRPTNVMGATKRIAELLVAEAARRTGRAYVSVRFGNVLGSSGSVLPIFREQLENGEPLTITDPAMTRYFMTIPEAAWLVLDAAALGRDGDLFVLDMGEPVRVLDLARDLVRLAGRDPDSQPIETVGLRPGEKLHEELFYDAERVRPTSSPKVLRTHAALPPPGIRDDARRLLAMATGADEPGLRAAVLEYVHEVDADWS